MVEQVRKPLPPLKGIAGLGNVLNDAKRGIDEVRRVTRHLGSETAALVSDVNVMRDHVRKVHEDLHFEASTLGNGGAKTSDEQSVAPEDVGKVEDVLPLSNGSPPAAEPGQ